MSLEKTIKFYEEKLSEKSVKSIKGFIEFAYKTRPNLFKRDDAYKKFYLNALINEYMEKLGREQ